MNTDEIITKDETHEEHCWRTGNYISDCNCENCPHKDECSGYNG